MLDPKRKLFPYTKSFFSHEILRSCKASGIKNTKTEKFIWLFLGTHLSVLLFYLLFAYLV